MRDYRSTRAQRIMSEIRYIRRYELGNIIAGIATMAIMILAQIIMAIGR